MNLVVHVEQQAEYVGQLAGQVVLSDCQLVHDGELVEHAGQLVACAE